MDLIESFLNGFWYCWHYYWLEAADPRTKDFPMMEGGPEKVIAILSVYLLFVKFIGPRWMRNREPFVLRTPMLIYNTFLVIVNSILFINILLRIDYGRRFLNFKFPDPNDRSPDTMFEIRAGYYVCYLTRFLDLFDTIFFVLRKKDNQITFLHLYHHTLVPMLGYMTVKIAPNAPVVILFLMFNTLIHSLMYLYYALTIFGPKIQKYLWWKKYITQLQLMQFVTCGFYGIIMMFLQEGFPAVLFWFGFSQNPFFLYMFYDFYKKTYGYFNIHPIIDNIFMDPITRLLKGLWYCFHQYWLEAADPRTKKLPLIEAGPEKVFSILLVYLLFVKYIGPWFMRDRQPYVLRGPMLIYNTFMVVVNIFIFHHVLRRIDYGRRFLNFKFPDPNDRSPETLYEIKMGYFCYLTRFLDLFDTVFFVLRKKNNQITFLHLYHHTLVPIIGYMTLKIAPQAPVVGLFLMFNTFIHSVMYLYYALAAFGPHIQKYLWWKKYITQLQLVQFATCGIYGVIMVFLQEGFPPGLFWLGFAQNPFFLYMFYDFYKKAYYPHQHKNLHQTMAISNGTSTKIDKIQ